MNHTQSQPVPSRTQPRVMLVEDDAHIAEAVVSLLSARGYTVEHSVDGGDALARLRGGSQPDLILLDLRMPNMNGWEFRVQQRREPKWAHIPVIVMSADRSAQASAIDADGYLQKPLETEPLIDTIEQLLASRERARVEARNAEMERMTSLGVLAAGLAHEVNNPLSFVVGNLELAQKKCLQLQGQLTDGPRDSVESLHRLLDDAQHGAERIAAVVRGVSTFARPDTEQVLPMDVQALLESSLQLVGNEIRHHARLERDYQVVPDVLGNPAKLGQVFINLLINAVHALGQGDAEHNLIRVATRLEPDGKVRISVSDTGSGIAPELVGRIFDPFFSTKAVGSGMGLGLAICQRLVANMGGTIGVESSPGHGSTFSVLLPSQAEPTPARTSAIERSAPGETQASVLVIDDEPMMCDLLCSMLEDAYQMTGMSSPRAALERLLNGELFDVVLCDLMMPELTGMDLYAELKSKRPEQAARFVFMTGGTFTDRASTFLEGLADPPLLKPFSYDEVRSLIDARLERMRAPATIAVSQAYH